MLIVEIILLCIMIQVEMSVNIILIQKENVQRENVTESETAVEISEIDF